MDRLLHWFWMEGIFYLFYILLTIAALNITRLIITTPLKEKLNEWQYRYRLRKIRSNLKKSQKEYQNPFMQHIFLLTKTTSKGNSEQDVLDFFVSTLLLFGITFFMIFLKFQDAFFGLVAGALVGAIPYMILKVKLRKLRYLMGRELLNIVQTLTQNYNVNHYDMYHALVSTQNEIQDKQLRKVFLRLISDLQVSKNEQELRMSVNLFIYTVSGSWAKRLGNIIIKSYIHNENVLKTLLILIRQIEQTEEMLEQEKSHTMDHVLNGFATIPVFIVGIILGNYSSGAQDWFQLQFGNPFTLSLFVMSVIGVIFSMFISLILRRPKNDI